MSAEPFPERAARPPALAILLAVFVLVSAAQVMAAVLGRDRMFREIPRLTAPLYGAWLAAPLLGIAGAIGLWNFRRWGLFAIAVAWVLVAGVDIWLGATPNAIIATGMMWLIVLFSRPIRGALR